MRAEHLRMWICKMMRDEYPELGNWDKVVAIIQAIFSGGEIVASCAWQTVLMISKGVGTKFRGICLVEVLCKAISIIINRRILSSIQFHDALHGFFAGRGMDTATLKVKLL